MTASNDEIVQGFEKVIERSDPSKVEGVDATLQFELGGAEPASYWLRVANGRADYGQGQAENARLTLSLTRDDFVALLNGGLNPMQAVMTGRIKMKGDTNLAMKLMPLLMS